MALNKTRHYDVGYRRGMARRRAAAVDKIVPCSRSRLVVVNFEQGLVADIGARRVVSKVGSVLNQISAVVRYGPVQELLAVGSGADS